MKVKDLIEMLEKFNPDLDVIVDAHDGDGTSKQEIEDVKQRIEGITIYSE